MEPEAAAGARGFAGSALQCTGGRMVKCFGFLGLRVGSGASCGGCGHGHAMAGGEKLSAEVGKLARGGERRGFQGKKEEWLT